MANPDLRDWLAQMEAAGELQQVRGANREEEIGGIVLGNTPEEFSAFMQAESEKWAKVAKAANVKME